MEKQLKLCLSDELHLGLRTDFSRRIFLGTGQLLFGLWVIVIDLPFASLNYPCNLTKLAVATLFIGMINRECPYPRGKVLGGSSGINALVYARGNKGDYDLWKSMGNAGWAYKDVLPYFIKSENSQVGGDPGYHGTGGYLNVEYSRPYSHAFYAFIEGSRSLGYPLVDYNGKRQLGVAPVQLNTIFGERHSTATAFLRHAERRENLVIMTNTLATKLLIHTKNKTCYGVMLSNEKGKFEARAKREVSLFKTLPVPS